MGSSYEEGGLGGALETIRSRRCKRDMGRRNGRKEAQHSQMM
jgi:hypothetical protein